MVCCNKKPEDVIRCQDCSDIAMEIDDISALILRFYSSIQRKHRGTDRTLWKLPTDFEFRPTKDLIKYIAPYHKAESNSKIYRRLTSLLDLELVQRHKVEEGKKTHIAITVLGDNGYLLNRYHIHGVQVDHPVMGIDFAA